MTDKTPGITDEAMSLIYEEMLTMQVHLDDDPLIYGPKRLNSHVATARNYLTRVQEFFQRVHRVQHKLKAALTAAEAAYQAKFMHLLATDPMVRAPRSQKDREAVAYSKMKDEIETKNELEQKVLDADMVIVAIKMKKSELNAVVSALREQQRLCNQELSLGGRWGSKTPKSEPEIDLKPDPVASALASQDVDELLADLGIEEGAEVPPRQELLNSSTEEEVEEALEEASMFTVEDEDEDEDEDETSPAPPTTPEVKIQRKPKEDANVSFAGTASSDAVDEFLDEDFDLLFDDGLEDVEVLFEADGGGDPLDENIL